MLISLYENQFICVILDSFVIYFLRLDIASKTSNPKIVLMILCLSICTMGKFCQMVCCPSDDKKHFFFSILKHHGKANSKSPWQDVLKTALKEEFRRCLEACRLVCCFMKYSIPAYTFVFLQDVRYCRVVQDIQKIGSV